MIRSVIRRTALDNTSSPALVSLMGAMHAIRLLHYSLHWSSSMYEDHLLFQRLYGCDGDVDISAEIDTLAEKIVSDFGVNNVKETVVHEQMGIYLKRWDTEDSPLARALMAEQELQELLSSTYATLKEEGTMTLGMDDFLMATANGHETHVYLLKQYL